MRRIICCSVFFLSGIVASAQKKEADSLAYYDALFNELDLFFDSITRPRNFWNVGLGMGNNYFNFQAPGQQIVTRREIILSPNAGFFHRSGFGINTSASLFQNGGNWQVFQGLVTASYDYIKPKLSTGINYSRLVTKDSLPFYTSPLKNEASAYFVYRKWWLRPAVNATYGWGSRSEVVRQETLLEEIRKKNNRGRGRGNNGGNNPIPITQISESTESISDFTLAVSVRHDFYWLDVLAKKNVIRFSPQLSLTSGTQRFGFNQTNTTYATIKNVGNNVLFNTENVQLGDNAPFRPLSVTAFLKSEVSFGKFYLQPQLLFDYYLPAADNRFNTAYTINTGFLF